MLNNSVHVVIEAIDSIRDRPVVVAIDGHSGVGKSTLARGVKNVRDDAVIIEGDDFYAGGTKTEWVSMSRAQRASHCMDWLRQRPVLEALRRGEAAEYLPFDWEAFDGTLSLSPVVVEPASLIILEGVYSARPELADLVDLRVLLDVSEAVRVEQLAGREGDLHREDWEQLWASAEAHYFGDVMPLEAFDLVLHSSP